MKKILPFLLLLLSSFPLLAQTIYYVKPSGDDANDGRSWATAFKTLQQATNTAVSGQIWVAAGTYYPDEGIHQTNNNRGSYFTLYNGVAIYGGFSPIGSPSFASRNWKAFPTILSGEIQQDANHTNNSYHVVQCLRASPTAILDGLTITGGNANSSWPNDEGGGLHCSNYGGYYAAIGPTIRNCTFTFNAARIGGAIYNYWSASPRISNCQFLRNTATDDGGAINTYSQASLVTTNCVFWKNTAARGGAIFSDQFVSTSIINCSFWGNTASTGAAIGSIVSSALYVRNSIVWGSNPIYSDGSLWSSITVGWSIVQGGFSGTGNKSTDPQFVNTSTPDLHVSLCSPAADAGDNSAVPQEITTDLDGNKRIVYTVDLGAYESQGRVVYVNQTATGSNNGTSWANAFTKLQNALAYVPPCGLAKQIWVAKGTYFPDENSNTNSNDRSASFSLKNYVAIYGGFAGTEKSLSERNPALQVTILSGDINGDNSSAGNSYHVVTSNGVDQNAVLDGFTIKGGNANETGNNLGAGMYNTSSSPTVVNCSFENNAANQGGGMYNKAASPLLTNCRFSANTANYGGGIFNESNTAVLTSCRFSGNEALIDGGGVYNHGASPTLVNCLFWNNTADAGGGLNNFFSNNVRLINCSFAANTATAAGKGGGIYNWVAAPTLTNCILWANTEGQIRGDDATVTYSLVQGAPPGSGNLDADPRFSDMATGDLHLRGGSPAIDTGNTAAVPASVTTDLDGKRRIYNGRVDLGVYEFQPVATQKPPVPYDPLTLTCPGDFTLESATNSCGAVADFTGDRAAITSGGKEPVTLAYEPASGSLLPAGVTLVTVTATDAAGTTETCFFTVTVVDATPPVITPPFPGVDAFGAHTDPDACWYTVPGTRVDIAASDNCPGPLAYFYSLSGATTTEGPVEAATLSGVRLNKGETLIHYLVRDGAGNEASYTLKVIVSDYTSPHITGVSVDKPVLYPPNHKLHDITVNYTAGDNCEGVSTTLAVSSNEAPYGSGSGDTGPDWEVIDDHHVRLRAERSGSGTGRVYTITLTATDAAGNEAHTATTVTVPHDMRAPVTTSKAVSSKEVGSLEVTTVPNPSADGFTLQLQSPSDLPLRIRVMDAAGRVIEQKETVAANGALYIGSRYRPGVYYLQVMQGDAVKMIKLIKQTP